MLTFLLKAAIVLLQGTSEVVLALHLETWFGDGVGYRFGQQSLSNGWTASLWP